MNYSKLTSVFGPFPTISPRPKNTLQHNKKDERKKRKLCVKEKKLDTLQSALKRRNYVEDEANSVVSLIRFARLIFSATCFSFCLSAATML